jgi:DNA-binding NarL/FixJ family response regulator
MELRMEGRSNKEVAQALGIVTGTVVNHFSAGMQDIHAALEAAARPTLPGSTGDGEI